MKCQHSGGLHVFAELFCSRPLEVEGVWGQCDELIEELSVTLLVPQKRTSAEVSEDDDVKKKVQKTDHKDKKENGESDDKYEEGAGDDGEGDDDDDDAVPDGEDYDEEGDDPEGDDDPEDDDEDDA